MFNGSDKNSENQILSPSFKIHFRGDESAQRATSDANGMSVPRMDDPSSLRVDRLEILHYKVPPLKGGT